MDAAYGAYAAAEHNTFNNTNNSNNTAYNNANNNSKNKNKALKTKTREAVTSGTTALLANLDLRRAPMSFPSGQKI